MTMHEFTSLDVATLVAGYRGGILSPLEVVRALCDHIERCEPHLHALYVHDRARALAAARDSEARWLYGRPRSMLDGVPCTLKENIATRGTPVPLGCAATELVPAPFDAPPAARLAEAGAVLLGKTTMPDLGMLSSGLSSFHPLTRNPWDLALNPGGSSAGAAAAAAAGYGPLHVGTDIGGSIRLPAGWCGLVGLKPSAGRVPIHPPYAGRVAGPMTRSVEDAARLMAVLSRPDPQGRDGTALPPQAIDWHTVAGETGAAACVAGLRGKRIGLWTDAGWGLAPQGEVLARVEAAARRLEAAGAIVEPVPAFTTRAMADGMDRFWRMRAWLDLQALPPERRARVLPYIVQWAEGASGCDGAAVFTGYSQMAALRDAALGAMRGLDLMISPVSPVPAYAAEQASPLDDPARPFEHIAFTLPFNMSEQPAVSVDAGRSADGRPVGLQIIGPRHDDLGVLKAARAWEVLREPPPPWPAPPFTNRRAAA